MSETTSGRTARLRSVSRARVLVLTNFLSNLPWWLFLMILMGVAVAFAVFSDPDYREAFIYIRAGLTLTIIASLIAYSIAIVLGLITGLGRISNSVVIRNIAVFYIETVRGIPMLVLIFSIAFVGTPALVGIINWIGNGLVDQLGLEIGRPLAELENSSVPVTARAIVALAVTYGAFLAEIFRAGIQSIGRGQMEAARSLGMSYPQAMWYIILPQAVRNILPALGNDFVAMIKDSSLISVLGIRDITQLARQYAGSSFRYPESYTTLTVLYLTMTVSLSLLIRVVERRLRKHV